MLPPETVIEGSMRWLRILRTSTLSQAWAIIRADINYTDLTTTQYASALEWLGTIGLVVDKRHAELSDAVKLLPDLQTNLLLFERCVEYAAPAWLRDADLLIPDSTELPQDVSKLAHALGLQRNHALHAIRHLHGKIDLAQRTRIGESGETAIVDLLESRWPGSTSHVSKVDDGFGYDVAFRHGNSEWHLEIKTTTRRGRLLIYLSRHEHEYGIRDPNWRLIIVGLNEHYQIKALATVRYLDLASRAPKDLCTDAKWQATSYELSPSDLEGGLDFLPGPITSSGMSDKHFLLSDGYLEKGLFAWMPT